MFLDWLIRKPYIVKIKLKEYIEPKEDIKITEDTLDRDFHNYIITKHADQRMKQRKISLFEISLAFKFGKLSDKGIILNVSDIPDIELDNLENRQLKQITRICPLTLVIDFINKSLITLYPNNTISVREKIISDNVKTKKANIYARKIKDKLRDNEKINKKLAKKLRPYKENNADYI